jgi:hypothetical protein
MLTVSAAASNLAVWVGAVYAYAAEQEKKLSNFALLSTRFDHVPLHLLGRYKPPLHAPSSPF